MIFFAKWKWQNKILAFGNICLKALNADSSKSINIDFGDRITLLVCAYWINDCKSVKYVFSNLFGKVANTIGFIENSLCACMV